MGSQLPALNAQLRGAGRRRGFALLITITLLAFIMLLLLGLAVYTRIETSVAGNMQRQAQARENALLALNVALGQLQAAAGPDKRVTATADALPNRAGTRRYVGVWPSDPADDPDGNPLTPLTWLVSGNEAANPDGSPVNPLAVTPESTVTVLNGVSLVGANTSGVANDVLARLTSITATGVPGAPSAANTVIGRYAWWVGDQGVKAPVAVADTSSTVNFAPYDSAELRSRIRQQVALGAGAADSAGTPVFEPRDANNTSLVANQKITAFNQIAFLRNTSSAAVGVARTQQNFHAWSPNNFNVLANTKLGGLRQDLSLDPTLLGSSVHSWLNYSSYMEPPVASPPAATPTTAAPNPDYGDPALRRRYKIQASVSGGGPAQTVAPLLSYFLLSFNIRTKDGLSSAQPLEARAFWKVALWNPYTSALVPEEQLRLEVTGLPRVHVDNETLSNTPANVSLQTLFGSGGPGSPVKILLPWVAAPPSGVGGEDRASWLPGRVYNWRSIEETTGTVPTDGYPSRFYSKSYTAAGESNGGVIRPLGSLLVDGNNVCHVHGDEAPAITAKLLAVRSTGEVELATFTAPAFVSFRTNSREILRSSTQFVFFFRLAESTENPGWLQTPGADPRETNLGPPAYVYGPGGDSPSAYAEDYEDSTFPDRLLDRETTSRSYNQDVPVFELPRAPVLSLGALQHVALPGQRPFAIGNSWGAANLLNATTTAAQAFDQFFLSGFESTVSPVAVNGSLLLPNTALKVLSRKSDGAAVTPEDLRPATPTGIETSRLALAAGAFNLNSVNPAAWTAVLRGVRFPSPSEFRFLNADQTTGTADDATTDLVQSSDAQFFRFSQSAQETYKAEPGQSGGAAATELFRRGMRTLTSTQVAALAGKIVELSQVRQATDGPFRSLEEFLSPSLDPSFAGQSLLERAITDAGINASIAEFSSQWLTQADIMTALAPVLFPRSDTFVIRTYGEAVNPATSATEGRAWCEAIVQRVPDYLVGPGVDAAGNPTGDAAEVAPADLVSEINKVHGRRFKVVSFRWLTRSDI